MTDESTDVFAPAPRGRIECAVTTLAAASALLLLDNQLGPVSFTLRRAAAATVLATLAVLRWTHKSAVAAVEINDGSGAVSPSRAATGRSSVPTNLGWSIAGWAAVIAALALVGVPDTHAPERKAPMLSVPVIRPARSSKVLLVKRFQTQCSGHPIR